MHLKHLKGQQQETAGASGSEWGQTAHFDLAPPADAAGRTGTPLVTAAAPQRCSPPGFNLLVYHYMRRHCTSEPQTA